MGHCGVPDCCCCPYLMSARAASPSPPARRQRAKAPLSRPRDRAASGRSAPLPRSRRAPRRRGSSPNALPLSRPSKRAARERPLALLRQRGRHPGQHGSRVEIAESRRTARHGARRSTQSGRRVRGGRAPRCERPACLERRIKLGHAQEVKPERRCAFASTSYIGILQLPATAALRAHSPRASILALSRTLPLYERPRPPQHTRSALTPSLSAASAPSLCAAPLLSTS